MLNKIPKCLTMNFDRSYDSIFGEDITVIPLSDDEIDESYRKNVATMWHRVSQLRSPDNSDIEQEHDAQPTSVSVDSDSDDSLNDAIQKLGDTKSFQVVVTIYGEFTVPLPIAKAIEPWTKQIAKFEAISKSRIRILCELEGVTDRSDQIMRKFMDVATEVDFKTSTKEREKVARRLLALLMCESMIFSKVQRVAKKCETVEFRISDICETLSISTKDEEVMSYFKKIATKHYMLQRVFQLSPDMVKSLSRLLFSSDPGIRAHSKMELSSRTKGEIYNQIIKSGPTVLEACMSEARLTPIEILSVIFDLNKENKNHCLQCGTTIVIGPTLFHRECEVIKWLTQHCRFGYDKAGGFLFVKEEVVLSATQRARLYQVLRLNALLTMDVKHRTQGGLTIWERQPNGSLKKRVITTMKEEDIVGSAAWMRKQNFSSK